MSPIDYCRKCDALRNFIDRRGELIPAMLDGGIDLISLEYCSWHPFYFDEVVLDGEYWVVTVTSDRGEDHTLTVKATAEELEVYGEAKRFGDLCAKYGVKR